MESVAALWARTTIRKRAGSEIVDQETGEIIANKGDIITPELYRRITATLAPLYYIPRLENVVINRSPGPPGPGRQKGE